MKTDLLKRVFHWGAVAGREVGGVFKGQPVLQSARFRLQAQLSSEEARLGSCFFGI